jgi:arylsulfatase A-like enzyme
MKLINLKPGKTIALLLAGTGLISCSNKPEEVQKLPNVVIFLSDDQGYGDFGITGNRNLLTPNIDRLANEGAMFTRFFVSPVCSPTRAELLTGRYHTRSGVYDTSRGGERFNLEETTLAEVFRNAGYATGAFGKWHSGMQYPYHPNGRGFDEFYGFCSGHWGDYFCPLLEHNGKIVRGEGYLPDDLTNKALEFIEKHHHKPFLVYIPYNTPHSPMSVPDEWWTRFNAKELEMRGTQPELEDEDHTRAALAMCENLDWNVGKVMQKLKDLNMDENTIVLFFNDNGPNGHRWNDGMKGIKGSTDEGGVRTPLFIRWPGKIGAGKQIDEIAGAIDLLPTLAALAGIDAITAYPPDGVSLQPLLMGDGFNWPDRVIFSHWNGRISARNQQYRFDHAGKLYDMSAGSGQKSDISGENSEITSWFREQVELWKSETFLGMKRDNESFPVGHPDFRYTQLPARDGISHGGIIRSNRFPNSSYFTNWTSTDDQITWEVDVLADGIFEVEIYYTCPEADIGSTIRLSLGDAELITRITRPHDPPLKGAEFDRVERMESYEKDFIAHHAGTIHLKKGKGELTLQALEIPGSQVMDFRLLMLTRVEEI